MMFSNDAMATNASEFQEPQCIEARGARTHNLKNISVKVPLHKLVGIAGVSGSGKSSLALGTLYAEGSRRYLDALSTYTRRRITQSGRSQVDEVLCATKGLKRVSTKLQVLQDLGLGYLTLGEATPALSGGEAQRLKLASELNKRQDASVFVFDEPTIGLHPLDVEVLLEVLERLLTKGATVLVIEHDLDVIANADYLIDMGPGGGEEGGTVVCAGIPEEVCECEKSITGMYLKEVL